MVPSIRHLAILPIVCILQSIIVKDDRPLSQDTFLPFATYNCFADISLVYQVAFAVHHAISELTFIDDSCDSKSFMEKCICQRAFACVLVNIDFRKTKSCNIQPSSEAHLSSVRQLRCESVTNNPLSHLLS